MEAVSSDWAWKIIAAIVVAVLGWVFGPPLVKRRKSEESATAAQADADTAEAELVKKSFRRADSELERSDARVMRAEKRMTDAETARDEALEAKRKAIEDASKLVQAARDDVHEVRNDAMVRIAAAERNAKMEIERIQHAAEASIASANGQVQICMDKIADRDRINAGLMATNEILTRRVEELSKMLNLRMDAQKFDPTTTHPFPEDG